MIAKLKSANRYLGYIGSCCIPMLQLPLAPSHRPTNVTPVIALPSIVLIRIRDIAYRRVFPTVAEHGSDGIKITWWHEFSLRFLRILRALADHSEQFFANVAVVVRCGRIDAGSATPNLNSAGQILAGPRPGRQLRDAALLNGPKFAFLFAS